MAYQKLSSGDFMVCGYVPKDAELKFVGQNQSSKTTFSIKASETTGADGTKTANWTSCVAWHDLARVCEKFKKGDFVLAIGRMESHEYEGKTYKNLVVEFAVKAGAGTAAPAPVSDPAPDLSEVGDLDISEYEVLSADDCPF